jgi:hypothetical protein
MRTVPSRALRGLLAAAAVSVVLGTTIPAFAATARGTGPTSDPLGGLTADRIAAKALADLTAATSIHVSDVVTVKGISAILLNATVTHNACAGSTGLIPGGGTSRFIQIGKREWVLLTEHLLANASYTKAEIARYAGKWAIDNGPNSPFGYITCSMTSAAPSGFPRSGWAKGPASTVAGQHAIELSDAKKELSLWVSDSYRPEILKVSSHGAVGTFSRYNAKVTITPPPASDVVSLPAPPITPPPPSPAQAARISVLNRSFAWARSLVFPGAELSAAR